MNKELGKPQPDSEVINKHPKTLILGYGWVGQYVGKYFTEAHWTDESGKFYNTNNEEVEPLLEYEIGFICVPTPPLPSGKCDTSIVEQAYYNYPYVKDWCIKSTVEIGTCEKLGDNVCMSPEYVGETLGHPLLEPKRDTFIILGGPKDVTQKFAEAWTLVTNSYTKIYQVPAKTAELCKLMENSFIATKVMFMNQFYDLAKANDVDFNELREIFLADPRVSRSHTYVYENNRGFAGKCLPKDLNNLRHYSKEIGADPWLIDFLLEKNKELRNKNEKETK